MRVGVTGGTGFIGQYLIRDYGESYDFVVPVRDKSISNKVKEDKRFVECDYTVDGLKKVLDGCDAVIHLAGKCMHENSKTIKMQDYLPTIIVSSNVFEACREIEIKNIVYASSRAVWSEQAEPDVLNESESPRPGNEYGVSKLCGEVLAEFYNDNYGMKIKSYRIVEVCGLNLSQGMLNPFWKVLLTASVEKRVIPIYGIGIAGRDLIYVKDVTRALIVGLDKDVKGIYNIGCGRITTNMEIAEAFCKIFKNEGGIELHPEKKEGGTTKCLDVEKAKRELGFEAGYDLLHIVDDIKKEYDRQK